MRPSPGREPLTPLSLGSALGRASIGKRLKMTIDIAIMATFLALVLVPFMLMYG
jgi:hypothetical protein